MRQRKSRSRNWQGSPPSLSCPNWSERSNDKAVQQRPKHFSQSALKVMLSTATCWEVIVQTATPRLLDGAFVILGIVERTCVFGRPCSDLLSQVLRLSTIGAEGFDGRVRDGIGSWAPRKNHKVSEKHTS